MQIIDDIKNIEKPLKNTVITIGNFDGVHLGHKALFKEVKETAERIKGKSVAITFNPHPLTVLKKDKTPLLITPHATKVELIKETGIDILLCVRFNEEFASISAEDFITEILLKKLGVKVVIVGNDYTFGKNRRGNIDMMREFGEKLGFKTKIISEIKSFDSRISSTNVRHLIKDGKVLELKELLGRFYQIKGKVITGRKRGGKVVGFPTANIMPENILYPKKGVYATVAEYEGVKYKAVSNIGVCPSFGGNFFSIETYIIDFDKDIYDKELTVYFIKRIRGEKKFESIEELSGAIENDVKKGKEILSCLY